jgi:diguanylate cyclase (GGDEF)-like protein/PAS domain S-box-containing protein
MPLIQRRNAQLLGGGGLCVGLVLAAAVTWFGVTTRQSSINDSLREMRNDALILSDQEDRLLQSVEIIQLGLIDHMREIGIDSPARFEQLMATRAVQENLADRISGATHIARMMLFDRHGLLLNYSHGWPPPLINDADRDFITRLTEAGAPRSFVSEPSLSKISGQWIIHLSRRFEASDGRLIGFVVSTIRIDYFEQFYAQLPLTGGGAFTLFRDDGMLLARYPRVDPRIGKTFTNRMDFHHVLETPESGVSRQTSVFDGKDRLIVPHRMAHFPLIITVSDTMESILASWWDGIRVAAAGAVLMELMIAGSILLALRHLRGQGNLRAARTARALAVADLVVAREREQAAQMLHQQELRFDMAVNNLHQGLCMHDLDGRIVVANRRITELFGLAADAMVPGTSYDEVTAMIVAAGAVSLTDIDMMRELRRELVATRSRGTFAWNLESGRTLMIIYQPMETGWLTTYEDITERRQAEARITHMARHDGLTNLPNRVLFHEKLEDALAFARRGSQLALLCLDLDQFKAVNDTLGHPVGDGLLRAVAQRLRDNLRETDTVARLGSDEFAVVQTAIASPLDATGLASELIELMRKPFEIDGHQIIIGVSIGIAFAPQDGLDADHLLKCADLALYRAKVDGRGVWRVFQAEMDAAMQARRVLELDLRQALDAGQLELFYQPLIDVRTRRAAGCEALLRWRHPEKGLIPPDRFIPLAEETGLIIPIGEWVLRQACATAAGWPDEMKVAVNLSAVQFKSRDLVEAVVDALRISGLPANRLELEITETVMLRDTDATLATLHQLRVLGIHIAMDDFGTGYSSLSYLRRFPFDRIKIDQSFIRELGKQDDCIAIVRAVTTLGRDLGIAITAEGVETRQQRDTLEQMGCTELQGYLFSRAVPAADLIEVLRLMSLTENEWPTVEARALTRQAPAGERVEAFAE